MWASLGLFILTLFVPAAVSQGATAAQETSAYGCPVHREVQSSTPGECPKCGRALVPQAETKRDAEPGAEAYTCPMHPEIRESRPGKCTKCEMALVPAIPAIADDFDLVFEASPRAIAPNETVRLRFTVLNPATGEQVKRFAVMHEKIFHLFVVSQDMDVFQHIHPTLEADGTFQIETVLPRPGYYKVYSDFYPVDGVPQVIQRNLVTAGYKGDLFSARPHLEPDRIFTKTLDGMKIELTLDPPDALAGRFVNLRYRLTDARTQEPVRDLRPYLGAWGHTLILSEDQSDYVHSHPTETVPEGVDGTTLRGGPEVNFEALLPKPGNYRIWTQVQRGETLITVSFTVAAKALGATF